MTLLAVLAELSTMLVGVTADTTLGKAEKGPIEVLDANIRLLGFGNVGWIMAFVAGESTVLSVQRPSSFRMVKLLL